MNKICGKCGQELSIDNFFKSINKKDGLGTWCKDCNKAYKSKYYKDNQESISEKHKKYNENNKEHISEKKKEYAERNKESIAIRTKQWNKDTVEQRKLYRKCNKDARTKYMEQWRKSNKEEITKWTKLYREENKEYIAKRIKLYRETRKEVTSTYNKQWLADNPGRVTIITERRRSRKKQLPSTLTFAQWKSIKDLFNNECCYCGNDEPLTQDHFIPLSKGGEYTHNNIVPACKSCNCSKATKDFFEWYPMSRHYNKKREQKILKYLNYKNGIQQLALL